MKQNGIALPILIFLLTGAIVPAGVIAVFAKPAVALLTGTVVLAKPAVALLAEAETPPPPAVADTLVPADEATMLAGPMDDSSGG